jgi:hypothetical protein
VVNTTMLQDMEQASSSSWQAAARLNGITGQKRKIFFLFKICYLRVYYCFE